MSKQASNAAHFCFEGKRQGGHPNSQSLWYKVVNHNGKVVVPKNTSSNQPIIMVRLSFHKANHTRKVVIPITNLNRKIFTPPGNHNGKVAIPPENHNGKVVIPPANHNGKVVIPPGNHNGKVFDHNLKVVVPQNNTPSHEPIIIVRWLSYQQVIMFRWSSRQPIIMERWWSPKIHYSPSQS